MSIAAKDYGKSRLSQIVEIVRLALETSHISAKEYYDYRLFDDSHFSFPDKRKFIGRTTQEQIKKILIDDRWKILADDKFLFATLFKSQGFPIARILATYNYRPNKRARSIPSLSTTDELKSFLGDGAEYPLFAKPVAGSYGSGCFGVRAFDRTTNRITLANNETLTIDQLIDGLRQFPDGYMFQESLHPHRAIRDVCGDRLASVRVVVLLGAHDAWIARACIRIPTGTNMSDNFAHGQAGNLVAAVALEDGSLGKAFQGLGADQKSCEVHPDTGKRIQGLLLPYWQEVKDLCVEAAMLLPGFRLQSWDIAICDEGPVLQEVQSGNVDILQLASQQGMLDDDLRRFFGSVNRHWRREIILSFLDEIPRRIYRAFYPKRSEAAPVETAA